MFERIKKILIVLSWFVQFALCLAIKYLEKLSRVKAGVNHHLYFKKEEYMQMFFTDEKIRIMFICALVLLAIALLLMMVAKNKKNIWMGLGTINQCLWSSVFIYDLIAKSALESIVYPYAMFVLSINIVIAVVMILLGASLQTKVKIQENINNK